MPPEPLFDLSLADVNNVIMTQDEIYQVNPHRYEFQQLNGLLYLDRSSGSIAGYRDVRKDEFWVRGHIPGRPIFPGVLMIETAAHLVSCYVMSMDRSRGFLGFGGVDKVKFRGTVVPGQQIIMLGKMIEIRPRRCLGATQAFVDGQMVYEGMIVGMWL